MTRILALAVLATLAVGAAHAESDGEKRRKLMDAAEDLAVVAGASDVCGIDTGRLGGMYLGMLHELGVQGPGMDRLVGDLQVHRRAAASKFLADLQGEGLPDCTDEVRDNLQAQVRELEARMEEKVRRHAAETGHPEPRAR